ncbi:hypothetical protein [Sphingobacterium deserti]|uniref:Glycosyl transferase family 25 n=1 Tax=Sphingobacterium deserti TaxID=1229276 RepID=A0A0B8SZM3_9SPHI|nr:hypothetical protein [Sphingobacterium deserti]KGE13332.1 hypothetical protein DI53_2863 [Sphingobacterium deserti]
MSLTPLKIPTFIINLERRPDRKTHVLREFNDKDEFSVTVIPAIEDHIGGFGLSQTVLSIMARALISDEEFVLICEDDHHFTSDYDYLTLIKLIDRCDLLEADVLVGGPSWFDYGVRVDENLSWLNAFTGAQFLIVFKRFYKKLYNYPFRKHEHIDHVISDISDRIFTTNSIISVQHDFGYSDVNAMNNKQGVVSKLYIDIINRLAGLDQIYSRVSKLEKVELQVSDYESLMITTYAINLPKRIDRLKHIKSQFEGKSEFDLNIIEACQSERGSLGLWSSIRKAVQHAKDMDEDIVIICEDDHTFSEDYSKETLFRAIIQGAHLGADLILGGISNTLQAIVVSPDLCWVDTFLGAQFTIVYSNLFDDILTVDFEDTDAVDIKWSEITANKYVIHPFISTQKDFGYSDIPIAGVNTANYQSWFSKCELKLNRIRSVHKRYCPK